MFFNFSEEPKIYELKNNNKKVVVNMGTPYYLLLAFLFISSFMHAPIVWLAIGIIAFIRKEFKYFINFFIIVNLVYLITPIIFGFISNTIGYFISVALLTLIIVRFLNQMSKWHLKRYLDHGYIIEEPKVSKEDMKKVKIPFYVFVR